MLVFLRFQGWVNIMVALEISSVLLLISLCVFKIETSGQYLSTAHDAMLRRPAGFSYSVCFFTAPFTLLCC